jgi:hypothetical protein
MRWTAAVTVVALAGCPAGSEDILWLDERFEDADSLAAWTIGGETAIVATIHPGEHAIEIRDWSSMSHPISVFVWDDFSDGEWIEYTTNCSAAPTVSLQPISDGTYHVVVDIPTEPDGDDAYERVYASVPPVSLPATFSALTLRFDGNGPCWYDNVRFYQPANESGF